MAISDGNSAQQVCFMSLDIYSPMTDLHARTMPRWSHLSYYSCTVPTRRASTRECMYVGRYVGRYTVGSLHVHVHVCSYTVVTRSLHTR